MPAVPNTYNVNVGAHSLGVGGGGGGGEELGKDVCFDDLSERKRCFY